MVDKMTILIYYIENVDGKSTAIEYGRFTNGKVTGKISIDNITEDEVKRVFNKGYWRTTEIKDEKESKTKISDKIELNLKEL